MSNVEYDVEKVKEEILELAESKNRGQIFGYLQYMYELSNKDARELMEEVLGKRSLNTQDWEEIVEFLRTTKLEDKKEIIAKMVEIKDSTESSMNHVYGYRNFAQEYARQEVEAYKKSLENS